MFFDLLRHQVDTLRVILSHNFWGSKLITGSISVILAKNSKKTSKFHKNSRNYDPQECQRGPMNFFFWTIMLYLIRIQLICDKTSLFWSIFILLKPKMMKISRKSLKLLTALEWHHWNVTFLWWKKFLFLPIWCLLKPKMMKISLNLSLVVEVGGSDQKKNFFKKL